MSIFDAQDDTPIDTGNAQSRVPKLNADGAYRLAIADLREVTSTNPQYKGKKFFVLEASVVKSAPLTPGVQPLPVGALASLSFPADNTFAIQSLASCVQHAVGTPTVSNKMIAKACALNGQPSPLAVHGVEVDCIAQVKDAKSGKPFVKTSWSPVPGKQLKDKVA